LRLIDRGAELVSDDYTEVEVIDAQLIARAPREIAGLIEVRGIGIVPMKSRAEVRVTLHIVLDADVPRMPEHATMISIAGIDIPSAALAGLEPSAPIKLEMLLARVLEDNR
jgi:serine kinase of HPr protein (carbohydrate metabolism regulator)